MTRATLYVIFSACCFGSVIIFTELAKRGGATLLSVLSYRFLLGAVMLVVASGGVRRARLPRAQASRLFLLAGGGQAALTFLSLKALDYALPAATLAFLFYTYPAWVALFAAARGTDRLDRGRAIALGLSLGGIVLMVGAPWAGRLHPVGVLLALSAAIIYALYIPLIGRLQAGATPAAASVYATTGAMLCFALGGALTGTLQRPNAFGLSSWMAIAALALICTTLAFIAFLRGLAALGPVRTAIISTVEPFWTALLGALVLNQPLTARTLGGGAMIAGAVVILQRKQGRG
jgi:drug/metabolite transporter (DMT)-like permease